MTELEPNIGQFKSAPLVWILNVVLIGLGNLYANGNKKQCWYLIGFVILSNWFWHWWWSWPILYLISSFVGHGAVDRHNETIRNALLVNEDRLLQKRRTGSGGYSAVQSESHLRRSGPAPQITEDFQRKLHEAELEIRRRNSQETGKLSDKDYDEQVKRWLKPEQPDENRTGRKEAQESPSRTAGKSERSASNNARKQERNKNEGKSGMRLEQSGMRAASAYGQQRERLELGDQVDSPLIQVVSNTVIEPGPSIPPEAPSGFPAGLGMTGYQPYFAKEALGASPEPMSVNVGGIFVSSSGGGGTGGSGQSKADLTAAAGDPAVCNRCGTKCDHDFSFCLSCGHSYALS